MEILAYRLVLRFFSRKGTASAVLETSQGGFHPQKEPDVISSNNIVKFVYLGDRKSLKNTFLNFSRFIF